MLIDNRCKHHLFVLDCTDIPRDGSYAFFIVALDRSKSKKKDQIAAKTIVYKFGFEDHIAHFIETHANQARIYITALPRSLRSVNNALMKRILDNPTLNPESAVHSELQKPVHSPYKCWKIDIDSKDVREIQEFEKDHEVFMKFESPKGYHLLTSPFDTRGFKHDIQKDNLILLYAKIQDDTERIEEVVEIK